MAEHQIRSHSPARQRDTMNAVRPLLDDIVNDVLYARPRGERFHINHRRLFIASDSHQVTIFYLLIRRPRRSDIDARAPGRPTPVRRGRRNPRLQWRPRFTRTSRPMYTLFSNYRRTVEVIMAGETAPVINGTAWWALRRSFVRTLPKIVSETYLVTVLSLKEAPARNVLRNLKLLGLVGEDNRPTDLAIRWRDDEQYAAACEEIAALAYPDELRAAVPGPDPDATAAAQWFQRSRRLGDGGAKNAARTYVLIASAKLPGDASASATRSRIAHTSSRRSATNSERAPKATTRARADATKVKYHKPPATGSGFEMPRPQIAVQINIAPDMTAEQIDQVFASMAKHFYSEAGVD